MNKRILWSLFVLLLAGNLGAQTGSGLRGKIIDSDTGQPVFGATIIERASKTATKSDSDGKYELNLPPGDHTVEFVMYGFDSQKKVIQVAPGKFAPLNVTFGLKTLETVEVTDRAANNTDAGLLARQKKSASVSDGISAETIQKSPGISAGDVMKRVTGITLVGDKYIFVRGLGEKYSNTMLNGTMIPSTEPDKKVIPLDIFPGNILKNITVDKTFLPEHPGNFSGGLVKIETQEYPDEFTMRAGLKLGRNSQTTGQLFKTPKSYAGEDFGQPAEQRKLPALISGLPDSVPFQKGNRFGGLSGTAIALGANGMDNNWTPDTINAPMERGFNFSVGNTKKFENGSRIGYLYGTAYNRDYSTKKEQIGRYISSNAVNQYLPGLAYLSPQQLQDKTTYTEKTLWGNNFNLSYEPVKNQELFLKTLFSTQSDKYYQEGTGRNFINEANFISNSSGYIGRELTNMTLGGKHLLNPTANLQNHKLNWHYNMGTAKRDEPDLKQQLWTSGSADPANLTRAGAPNGTRFYGLSNEVMRNIDFDYELPFKQWSGLKSKFKFGMLSMTREKDFRSRNFYYQPSAGSALDKYPVPGEALYHPVRVFKGDVDFGENTAIKNAFTAEEKLLAKFVQVDMPIVNKIRFIGGARYEDSFQKTKTYLLKDANSPTNFSYGCDGYNSVQKELLINQKICTTDNNGIGLIHTKDVLPSANFVYEHDQKTNVRLAYSETVTRPDLRDLSPFGFSTSYGSNVVIGNPDLKRTYIHNYDLRYEKYLTATDYFAVGSFYKNLSNPIEVVGLPVAGDLGQNFVNINAYQGEIKGVEFDFRKDFLKNFRFDTNMYLIKSNVTVLKFEEATYIRAALVDSNSLRAAYSPTNLSRPLQGQSDKVLNLKLSYFVDKARTGSIALLYNYFSDRIEVVGTAGAADIKQRGVGVYDLVFEKNFQEKYNFILKAQNLNNVAYTVTQASPLANANYVYSSYKPGTTVSFNFGYKF